MITHILECTVTVQSSSRYYFTITGLPSHNNDTNIIIKRFIENYNQKKIPVWSNHCKSFKFILAYYGPKDTFNSTQQQFAQKELKKNGNLPIIHLTWFNCFQESSAKDDATKFLLSGCRHYQKIIDSSIWNFYVPIFKSIGDLDNFSLSNIEQLHKSLLQIHNNHIRQLYDLAITHEYADVNARLIEQSYLSGAHNIISPFLFHSEQEMHKKIDDFENENEHKVSIDTIREYRWRFLLLDDKSGERMSGTTPGQEIDICKLQIVAHNLRLLGFEEDKIWFRAPDLEPVRNGSFLPNNNNTSDHRILDDNQRIIEYKEINGKREKVESTMKFIGRVKNGRFIPNETKFSVDNEYPDNPDDIQIVIDCVKHVDAAQYCLQKYKYEIVLLDYLLYKDKVHGEQEYGYHLLRELHDWHAKKKNRAKKGNPDEILDSIYHPGPNGRFFFMFISAYTTAVHERLLAEGFPKAENGLWFIGDGACPTNTPYLFAYQLLLLMRNRIKDLSRASEGNFLTLIDLLKEIFVDETERDTLTDIRERAHDHFNHLLFMRDKYKELENDMLEDEEKTVKTGKDIMNMHSSLLVQSAFKRVHHFSGNMFEHLQHLVYLTAFGTIRQWTELWEEYVFIHKTLLQYDTLTGSTDGLRINKAIRNYIIQLKENSN